MLQILKVGTKCLFDDNRNLKESVVEKIVSDVYASNDDTVLVVSGAIAYGMKAAGVTGPKDGLTNIELQQYALMGNFRLANAFDEIAQAQDPSYLVSSLLVSNNSLERDGYEIACAIQYAIDQKRLMVINYNDGVDYEGVRLDNDTFAATILGHTCADRLIIFGDDYSGFEDLSRRLIPEVTEFKDEYYSYCNGKCGLGSGGFATKLDAAKMVMGYDREMIISNVLYSLDDIVNGNVPRTVFRKA